MISRRAFLRDVMAWSAGMAAVPMVDLTAFAQATPPMHPVVGVALGKDYAKLVDRVLEACGGIDRFVSRGDKVVVKPNIGWDRTPEQAANTHPDVVKRLVQLCLDAGAAEVKVFDRPCNDPRRCYTNSGIEAAVTSIGDPKVKMEHLDRRLWVPVDIKGAMAVTNWEFYRDAIECDCYINVPIAKHHGLTRLTLGLKNTMGVIGGGRGSIHSGIAEKLVDLNTIVAPKLTVIDATRILLRHGPQGGNLDDVEIKDTLIASADIVAADAYATTLFGLRPDEIESTVAGARRGLGVMDLAQMQVKQAA